MAFHRQDMQQRATKADCEQPYFDQSIEADELDENSQSVLGLFISRIRGQ